MNHDFFIYVLPGKISSQTAAERCVPLYLKRSCTILTEISPTGKPVLKEPEALFFSVSKSGDYTVCAIGTSECGIDLQQHRAGDGKLIAEHFFHPEERAFLNRYGYDFFFSIWCAKESYVKYSGVGITEDYAAFSAVQGDRIADSIRGCRICFPAFEAGYTLCLCAEKIDHLSVIRL